LVFIIIHLKFNSIIERRSR